MYHDPHLRHAPASPNRSGWLRRAGEWLGLGGAAAIVTPEAPEDEQAPCVDALAAALAQLIETAQRQVDGAAAIVGRSAQEASDYRRTLDSEADAMAMAALPGDVAQALIVATRSMIDRARGAEERLRGMALQLATLHDDLDDARAAAERDPLTGLPNRRALEEALARAVDIAHATRSALTLAFCDIDQFKAINDRHGHALGDRVLRLVADSLADGAGDQVFVGRQGGEEFVMLFAGVGADQTAIRVDAIRAGLAQRMLRSRSDEQPIGTVSFSAGVATLGSDEDADALLRRADAALYRAKHGGRNRVEIDRGA